MVDQAATCGLQVKTPRSGLVIDFNNWTVLEWWEKSRRNLLQSVQKQAKYYNLKRRDLEYEVGELVLLSSRNLSFKGVPTKLQKKFVGLFEIVEKIGAQAHRLKLPDS